MKKPFIKMHGLGNDFVVIDSSNNSYLYTIIKSSIQLISRPTLWEWACDQVIEMKAFCKTADILYENL